MGRRRMFAAMTALAAGAVLLWRLRPDASTHPAPVDEPDAVARLAAWVPPPPSHPIARVASYVWAAPLTAAGLLVGALSATAPRVHDGVLLFTNVSGVAARMLGWRGFQAATLGHVIIARDEPSAHLLIHELTHVRQAERLGPLFAPLYIAALVRYGYRQNPFERAAYLASDRSRSHGPQTT